MKFLLLLLLALVATVAITRLILQDPGQVLLTYSGYTIETSLAVAMASILLMFVTVYLLLRLLAHLYRLPRRMRHWRHQKAETRAEQDLVNGLMLMAEGKWERAEKMLMAQVANARTPLLNYLAAARAAQLQNAFERRDVYLGKATRSMPRAGTAVALTRAEYQYDHGQWEQALATLTALREQIPRHPRILKLLALTYQQLGDWPRLLDLVDILRRQNILDPIGQQRLETGVHRYQLEQVCDAEELRQLWSSLPAKMRADRMLGLVYVDRLLLCGAHTSAEKFLRKALSRQWDEELCERYGRLRGGDVEARMKQAETWLEERPKDAVLLLTAGRIALQARLWGVARRLLETGVELDPSAAGYQTLGALLEKMDETPQALACYRKGLQQGLEQAAPAVLGQHRASQPAANLAAAGPAI